MHAKPLLAKNFGLPEKTFDGFPKEEVYFARGPDAPDGCRAASGRARIRRPRRTNIHLLAQEPHSDAQGRPRVARRRRPIPHLADDDRRDPGSRTPEACASCIGIRTRTNGNMSSTASLTSRCSARTAAIGSRRSTRATWLHPTGLRPLDREHRQQGRTAMLIGFNTGALPGDRPVAMGRRRSAISARRSFRQTTSGVRDVSEKARLHRPAGRTREARNQISPVRRKPPRAFAALIATAIAISCWLAAADNKGGDESGAE